MAATMTAAAIRRIEMYRDMRLSRFGLSLPLGHVFVGSYEPIDLTARSLKVKVLLVPEVDLPGSELENPLAQRFRMVRAKLEPDRPPALLLALGPVGVHDAQIEPISHLEFVDPFRSSSHAAPEHVAIERSYAITLRRGYDQVHVRAQGNGIDLAVPRGCVAGRRADHRGNERLHGMHLAVKVE